MPRLLKFRPLCDQCEKSEASTWCLDERAALCGACDSATHLPRPVGRHRRVPIAASSVVSALCAQCARIPAATFVPELSLALCQICAQDIAIPAASRPGGGVPLRDSHVAGSIVFDKMDFSTMLDSKHSRRGHVRPSSGRRKAATERKRSPTVAEPGMWRWLGTQAEVNAHAQSLPQIDLSYFKTTVPSSVAAAGLKRSSRSSSRGSHPGGGVRVAGGRAAKVSTAPRREKK